MVLPQSLLAMVYSAFILYVLLLLPISSPQVSAQVSSSEKRILLRLQELLEYPPTLSGWTNWTNFCDLPPSPTLTIRCSAGYHISELSLIGNKTSSSDSSLTQKPTQDTFSVSDQTLSEKFSIDTFFTVLTKLSSLKVLSLVSLGLWGSLPPKVNRLYSLEVLNLSSNFIYGEIPSSIIKLQKLRSLVLSDNMLKGIVPDLTILEELNVGGNFLGPSFPTLGASLVSVILKNNSFRSVIPVQVGKLDKLQQLDFSHNGVIGRIPSILFSLPAIEYLDLAGNELAGALPMNISCSRGLKFVDLSDNHLVGDLPSCIRYNSSVRTVLYTWNCLSTGDLKYQHPNSFCHEKALAVNPPIANQKKQSSSKVGFVVGIIGAILGGVVVLVLLVLFLLWKVGAREAKRNQSKDPVGGGKFFNGLSPKLVTDARHVSSAMIFGALGLPEYHVFSLEEIEEATNCFDSSNLMREGSQGQVYRGWLRDGSAAVVRCLKLKQRYSSQALGRHMEMLPKLRHQHLVSILGHSLSADQDHSNAANISLIFEFVSNGTLRSHLSDPRKRDALKWPQRMAVTIGVARGIQFLHSGVTPGLFGNNLKAENILLDENLKAKISNYNLPFSSMVDSECLQNGAETNDRQNSSTHSPEEGAREDVYQLGVILLELIIGKQIASPSQLNIQRIQLEKSLANTPSELEELVDPSIRNSFSYESLRTTVEVTINCLSKNSSQRPSIEDVLWNLQYSVQVQDGWMPSGESFGRQSQS